ncbi:MAG: aspartate dehydrogenase [Lachnospiraceae bacterium]|nr:aspartate dehydrogenase [Lachnospiraceae bacterium]
MLFGRKNQTKTDNKPKYNPETHRPILRCSICTGEQVAGFKDIRTGKFEEVMLIRNNQELREFMEMYGVSEVAKEY